MFNDKILKSVAEAVKNVLQQEALKGQQHKIDKNKNGKVDAHDFKILRGETKPMKEGNNPFDVKNYKSQLPTKPGEKAGFDSKKISTGTVYTRKPVKDEKPLKEEDAYDKDRYAVKDGKAVKDNPGHMGSANYKDQPHHVYASSAEEALKKKGMKEEASNDEFHAEVKKAKEKSLGKQTADVAKAAVSAVKQESIEDVENFIQTEEYEQLDELSKNLVHRYWGKAIRRHRAVLDKDIDIGDEHQKIKRLMAKTNKGAQLGSRNKNPIHHPEVQKHLKAASDAVAKMREPAQKEMAKREKGIDKAYSKLNSGKDRDGNKVVKATGKLTNKRMYGEESEQLDELSKNTLSSYVDKATDSARTMPGYGTKNEPGKKSKRMAAISVATSRIKKTNEELEQLDELSRGTLTSYATSAGQSLGGAVATIGKAKEISKFYAKKTSPEEVKKDAIQRAGKRMVGLGRAASRLNKEEVEQIDELSKDTLKSYSAKAKASAKSHRDAGNQYDSDPDERAFAPKQYKKAASRTAGAAKADSRIKEELEQINELEMTGGEMKKREKIVKSMKKGMQGFKERYGKDAKSVMYATATKQAMKD